MRHRHSPDIDAIPELAEVFGELRTEEVPNPPRGYATVERILLPDGSCIHESSQYGFAPVVARWLWANGYRAGQGTVAAYEANEQYLAGECGMGEGWVRCNRRCSIASSLVAYKVITTWGAGFPGDEVGKLYATVAAGRSEIDALASAVDRLMRNGYRVGMSRMTVMALLEADGGPRDYKPTQDDAPWISVYNAKRPGRPFGS